MATYDHADLRVSIKVFDPARRRNPPLSNLRQQTRFPLAEFLFRQHARVAQFGHFFEFDEGIVGGVGGLFGSGRFVFEVGRHLFAGFDFLLEFAAGAFQVEVGEGAALIEMFGQHTAQRIGGGAGEHRHAQLADDSAHAGDGLHQTGAQAGHAAAHNGGDDVFTQRIEETDAVQLGQLAHHVELYGAHGEQVGARKRHQRCTQGETDVVADDFGGFLLFFCFIHSVGFGQMAFLLDQVDQGEEIRDSLKRNSANKSRYGHSLILQGQTCRPGSMPRRN